MLERWSSRQRLFLGLAMLFVVDLIWVGSSELTEVSDKCSFQQQVTRNNVDMTAITVR